MSLLYILDGYNIIKRSSLFNNKTLFDARLSFFSFIQRCRPQGSTRNRLIVVFDGIEGVGGYDANYPFEVVFTKGETADERIIKMVAATKSGRDVVVVTDDRDLSRRVQVFQARVIGVPAFLEKGTRVVDKEARRAAMMEKADLTHTERSKITQELKRLWLKEE